MTTTQLLSASEEIALATVLEIGVIAEEALRGGFAVDAGVDELELLAQEGRAARDRLLLANVGLVKAIARGEFGVSPAEFAEVVQEGHLALAEALVRYDHRRGRFGPYAAAWIRARVRGAIATQCGRVGVPARDMARYFAVRRAEVDLMQCLGRSVTPSEVPGADSVTAVHSIVTPVPFVAALYVPDESAVEHLDVGSDSEVLRLLDRLPAVERRILKRRFGFAGPPASRQELARELGVSEATVRRTEVRALTLLRHSLARLAAA
jgi:RNA polymerase sigma factor (sigma-70 family)